MLISIYHRCYFNLIVFFLSILDQIDIDISTLGCVTVLQAACAYLSLLSAKLVVAVVSTEKNN